MTAKTRTGLLAFLTALFLAAAVFPPAASDNGGNGSGSSSPDSDGSDAPDDDNSGPGSGSDANDTDDPEDDNSGPGSGDDDDEEEEDDEDRSGRGDGDDDEDDDEDDREDDDDEDRRKVEVSTDEDGLRIRLERENASVEDKIEMGFKTEDAKFEVKFEQEAGDAETEMKLEAQFLVLAEYRDGNGNGRYDVGEPLVSAWALADEEGVRGVDVDTTPISWGAPSAEDVTLGNVSGKKIIVPATFDGAGEFQLVMHVFGDFVDLNGSDLKPTSVKIDVVIGSYPFAENDTALALFLETESKRELEIEHGHDDLDDDEDGIAATQDLNGTAVSLVFAWKEFADVDGVQRPVNTTTIRLTEETEAGEWERKELFAFSYARGTNITHDPEVFVSIQAIPLTDLLGGPSGNWLLVAAGAAAVGILVASTLGPRLRRP